MKLFILFGTFAFIGVAVASSLIVVGEATKAEVITETRLVIKHAQEVIQQLVAQHRTREATVIQNDVHSLEKLVSHLQTATAGTTVYMLEKQINEIKGQIAAKLVKAAHSTAEETFYDNGHQREVLQYRAKYLLAKANNAIQQLKAQGKLDDIRILEQEEATIRQMATKLEAHKTGAELAQIENELRSAELKILHEVQRLHLDHSVFRRDLKVDLITKGNALLKQASNALLRLNKLHNTREMSFIKREEALIKKWIKQLEIVSETEHINQLKHSLRIAELRMSYYLIQATHPHKELPDHQQLLKQILEQRAANLAKQAEQTVAKLKIEKNDDDALKIEKDKLLVSQLVKQIKQIKTGTHLLVVEQELTIAENRLSQEISKALQLPNLI